MKTKLLITTILLSLYGEVSANYLTNFGEPNTDALVKSIQNNKIHIIQLGDSHTAGDSMTQALRSTLQQRLGNGGMGWGMPMYFSGQRLTKYGYDNQNWQPISSRSNQSENYTIGGLIAKPKFTGATLTIKPKQYETTQKFIVSLRQGQYDQAFSVTDADGKYFSLEAPIKDNSWQLVEFTARPPFKITANYTTQSAIGGWWAFNENSTGATVSSLGINGAELTHWSRWNETAWQKELKAINPELIILAYGTNEAYNGRTPYQVESTLNEYVQKIRKNNPQSAIMIISAPESLKNTAGTCGTRPKELINIQIAQQNVAKQHKTLYWDWQAAMGGQCSMKSWISQGKASRDGVHFSHKGYQQLGEQLAQDLLQLTQAKQLNNIDINQSFNNKSGDSTFTICQFNQQGKKVCNTI